MQSTGQTSTQARSLTPMQASVITYVMQQLLRAVAGRSAPAGPSRTGRCVLIRRGVGVRKVCCRVVVVAALLVSVPRPAVGQSCDVPRTALVLSGGGAKGLAHIGVVKVLDSLGYRPDLIVGTSMGAIVGAMYASGYSGRDLDSLARRYSLADLVRAEPRRLARTMGPLRPLIQWEPGRRGLRLRTAVVDEPEINALVTAGLLPGNLLAAGNFDSLPIPFRAVATNLATGEPRILAGGDLAQAVRASFAIPVVFRPVLLDDSLFVDGGIADNVPVDPARLDSTIRRVIVSDVGGGRKKEVDYESPIAQLDRIID